MMSPNKPAPAGPTPSAEVRALYRFDGEAALRDEWLGRAMLCAHHAVPPTCFGPAFLVRTLGLDELGAGRALGWAPIRIAAALRRFDRRCRALRLTPTIPPGRDFVIRYRRLLRQIETLAEEFSGPSAASGLAAVARATDLLIDHPLAGSPEAHRLRAWVHRFVAGREIVGRARYRVHTA